MSDRFLKTIMGRYWTRAEGTSLGESNKLDKDHWDVEELTEVVLPEETMKTIAEELYAFRKEKAYDVIADALLDAQKAQDLADRFSLKFREHMAESMPTESCVDITIHPDPNVSSDHIVIRYDEYSTFRDHAKAQSFTSYTGPTYTFPLYLKDITPGKEVMVSPQEGEYQRCRVIKINESEKTVTVVMIKGNKHSDPVNLPSHWPATPTEPTETTPATEEARTPWDPE